MNKRHLKTILKTIGKLEIELYRDYTSQEIYDALNELEKEGLKSNGCDLLWVIYDGVASDLDLDDEYEREDEF